MKFNEYVKFFLFLLLCVGAFSTGLILAHDSNRGEYKPGDCVSNGLFVEQIESSKDGTYVTVGYVIDDDGSVHVTLPERSDVHVLDHMVVKVKCPAYVDVNRSLKKEGL